MSESSITIRLNHKDYIFDTRINPFVMVISEKGSSVDIYNYQEVFENVFVKESFKKSMNGY